MTKNGKQKMPKLLQEILGVQPVEGEDLTLEELLQRDFTKE